MSNEHTEQSERARFEAWADNTQPAYWRTTAWARDAWQIWKAALLAADKPAEIAVHSDDAAVDRFASAMKEKLATAREKGRGGWETCTQEDLSRMLREHVEKGDPLDVANFCMFLWNLGYGIDKPAESGGEPCGWMRVEMGHTSWVVAELEWGKERPAKLGNWLPLYTKPQADKAGGEAAAKIVGTSHLEGRVKWMKPNSLGLPLNTLLYTHPQPQPSALPDDVVKDAERMFAKGWRAGLEHAASNWETWYGFDKHGAAEMCREIKHDGAAIDAAMLKEGK